MQGGTAIILEREIRRFAQAWATLIATRDPEDAWCGRKAVRRTRCLRVPIIHIYARISRVGVGSLDLNIASAHGRPDEIRGSRSASFEDTWTVHDGGTRQRVGAMARTKTDGLGLVASSPRRIVGALGANAKHAGQGCISRQLRRGHSSALDGKDRPYVLERGSLQPAPGELSRSASAARPGERFIVS